jgi:hypothetical protein
MSAFSVTAAPPRINAHNVKFTEDSHQRAGGNVLTDGDPVAAFHENLGLHDRYDARHLAPRRVASQGVRVRVCGAATRQGRIEHRAQLGEDGTALPVRIKPVTKAVQSLGDDAASPNGRGMTLLSTSMPAVIPSAVAASPNGVPSDRSWPSISPDRWCRRPS